MSAQLQESPLADLIEALRYGGPDTMFSRMGEGGTASCSEGGWESLLTQAPCSLLPSCSWDPSSLFDSPG